MQKIFYAKVYGEYRSDKNRSYIILFTLKGSFKLLKIMFFP